MWRRNRTSDNIRKWWTHRHLPRRGEVVVISDDDEDPATHVNQRPDPHDVIVIDDPGEITQTPEQIPAEVASNDDTHANCRPEETVAVESYTMQNNGGSAENPSAPFAGQVEQIQAPKSIHEPLQSQHQANFEAPQNQTLDTTNILTAPIQVETHTSSEKAGCKQSQYAIEDFVKFRGHTKSRKTGRGILWVGQIIGKSETQRDCPLKIRRLWFPRYTFCKGPHNQKRELYMGSCEDPKSFGCYETTRVTTKCWVSCSYTNPPNADMRDITRAPRILDLFCGCGGLSHGFEQAGFPITWGVEKNPDTMKTYIRNHTDVIPIQGCAKALLLSLEELIKQHKPPRITEDNSCVEEERDHDNENDQIAYVRDLCFFTPNSLQFLVSWIGLSPLFDSWVAPAELSADELSEFLRSRYSNFSGEMEENSKDSYEAPVDSSALPCIPLPGEVTILIGGPPCQGVSKSNCCRELIRPLLNKDNQMMRIFAKYIKLLHPEVVLFENVPGIFDPNDAFLVRYLISNLVSLGYQVRTGLLNACCFGAPQSRWRTFIWASRSDIYLPKFPTAQYTLPTGCSAPNFCKTKFRKFVKPPVNSNLPLPLTVWDAISDLAEDTVDEGGVEYAHSCQSTYQAMMRMETDTTVTLHRSVTVLSQHPLLDVPLQKDGTLPLSYRQYRRPPRDRKNFRCYHRGWKEVFLTVTGAPQGTCLHPHTNRTFSIRENARAQGFGDSWYFFGSPSAQMQQIANAVPVPLARSMAEMLSPENLIHL
ncbi:CMT-type DNA-methyltransferase [Pelomyxa schiedti]|nr:CMT-type DNA-methyltransferase [Pelomyxa schiedti]